MAKVLVIDDDVTIVQMLKYNLADEGYEVVSAFDGKQGLKMAASENPDVILLDVMMPEMNGFDTCRKLKDDPNLRSIPIIMMSVKDLEEDVIRGLDNGAMDYVTKPFSSRIVLARVRSAARTKYLMDLLANKAQVDGLTGLYNRTYFEGRSNEEFQRSKRYGNDFSLIMVDIDRFKRINDTHGHLAGDHVLRRVSQTLESVARKADLVCRYGGEEFAIILTQQDFGSAGVLAHRLREGIESTELMHDRKPIVVSASFGVCSTSEAQIDSTTELVDAADKALYAAKENGRNRVFGWKGRAAVEIPVISNQ